MENPNSSLEDVSKIISKDPGMASMILKMANQEIFGYKGQVESIERAVELLGIGQIYEILSGVFQILALPMGSSNNVVPFPVHRTFQAGRLCA